MKIGLISDTHGFLDEKVFHYFKDCDQIWHAGDIGNVEIMDKLKNFKELVGVYGNIDDKQIRYDYPEYIFQEIENKRFLMLHIAGAPGKYNPRVKELIKEFKPDILICGHSHILRVVSDPVFNVLYINPGAAGNHGFHKVRTIIRFEVVDGSIKNMQAIELDKRA